MLFAIPPPSRFDLFMSIHTSNNSNDDEDEYNNLLCLYIVVCIIIIEYPGSLGLVDLDSSRTIVAIPFTFTLVSNLTGSLAISVNDEFTYFSEVRLYLSLCIHPSI